MRLGAGLSLSLALLFPAAGRAQPLSVGVVEMTIVDASRTDPIHSEHQRQWRVAVYYPAADAKSGTARHYAPDPALLDRMIHDKYYDVPEATLRDWAQRDGPMRLGARPKQGVLPLVTLSPGSGVAALNYAELAADIARRGYAVAVIDHPYLGLTRLVDGRILSPDEDPVQQVDNPKAWAPRIREWAKDISITLDRLRQGRSIPPDLAIDFRRIVATGHSLGGTVAIEVCSVEPRVSACADFEGTPEGTDAFLHGPRKPTLFTASRSGKPDRPHVAPDLGKEPWHFLARGPATNWAIAIRGGSHMSFTDAPREMPDTLSRFGGELMTPERSSAVYTGLVDALARAYEPGGGGTATMERFLATVPEAKPVHSGSVGPARLAPASR